VSCPSKVEACRGWTLQGHVNGLLPKQNSLEQFIDAFLVHTSWGIPLRAGLDQAVGLSKKRHGEIKGEFGQQPVAV
jgi:hypothetical protein